MKRTVYIYERLNWETGVKKRCYSYVKNSNLGEIVGTREVEVKDEPEKKDNANNTNTGITLMRISGKYAGAFFAMRASSTYASMPLDQLLCGEESTVFNQTAGEYCVKILKGKQVPNISSGTQYYAIF